MGGKIITTLRTVKEFSGLFRFALLSVVALYLYFKFMRVKGSTTPGNITEDSLNNYTYSESLFKKSKSELDARVKMILDSMNRLGTDEQTIFNAFLGLNYSEVAYIFEKFGVLKYDRWGGTGSTFIGRNLTLQGWLKNELSDKGNYSYGVLKSKLDAVGAEFL